MKTKVFNSIMAFSTLCLLCTVCPIQAHASEGEEWITISVDAVDDNGNLKYALDSDDPAAFSDSNEFKVVAGTSHTIYVKDVAGNITSQTYTPVQQEDVSTYPAEDEQRINIDLELGQNSENQEEDFSDYEYLTDDPVEPGTGTVAEKISTDGSDNAEKVFYTFTTKEGEVLYLVIDQGQSSDNVYLLDTVSASDLQVLADDSNYSVQENEEDNLLSALAQEQEEDQLEEETTESKSSAASASRKNAIIILLLMAIGGVAYYYFKIYKNKKDESMDALDAMDMDEFEPEEEEEIDFDIDDAEKEKYLEALINEEDENTDDESLFDMDPDEYATSHMEEDEYDADIDYPEDEESEDEEEDV